MFEDIFIKLHTLIPEIQMIGIWGKDGLELEKKIFTLPNVEIELLGAEIADVVARIDQIRVNTKDFRVELVTRLSRIGVFSLTHDYFLFIISADNMVFAKCKFYLELFSDRLQSLF